MSFPVKVSVQLKGGAELADYRNLTVSQFMFTHHVFSLDLSFEALGKALGLKPDVVHTRAHEKLSGKSITITWTGNVPDGPSGTFKFSGVIVETSVHTAADLTNYYHISGYSPTYLLEDGMQNRAFRQKSLQEIFQQVLAPYPVGTVDQELKPLHADKLAYVVQYGESNYQFLNRLAARQGEWLYYDGRTLRLGPPPHAAPRRFQGDATQTFAVSMRLQPGATEGAHYNYRTHEPLKAKAAAPTGGHPFSQFALTRSGEVFTQPHRLQADTHLPDQTQLKRALDTAAAKRAGSLVTLEGQGTAFDLVPGALLDVYDAAELPYGQFRVLAVRHSIDGDGNYSNHFEALPGAVSTPPPHPLAAAPAAHSELAEVIDLEDPRHLGRIRVRFQWGVKSPVDAESSWLRVSTPYSGDGKGQLFTPEKGSQVLVGYEQGLAEFPVVLGNLFHASNAQSAKYTTPNNNLKGLQTAGGNKVVMSDKKGEQTILLSNSNNKATAVSVSFKGDGSVHIHSKGPVTVNGSLITLDAGEKGEIKMHAKNITMVAEDDVMVSAKTKGISLDAKEKMALTSKELLAAGSDKATVQSNTELALNGGSKATLQSGKTKVH